MKFTTNREDLLTELNIFAGVVQNRPSDPMSVFSNVTLRPSGDGCELTASGGETGLKSSIAGEVEGEGMLSVPVGLVTTWLTHGPDPRVTFEEAENNWVEGHCGGNDIRIPGRVGDPPELPASPDKPLCTVPADTLSTLLRTGSYAFPAAADDTVVNAGAQIEVEKDDLRIVSSDHSRLAYASATLGEGQGNSGERVVFGLAQKTIAQLQLLARAGDAPVRFYDGADLVEALNPPAKPPNLVEAGVGNHLFFDFGQQHVVCAKLADRLPEYEHVVPRDCPIRMQARRSALLSAAEAALTLASGDFHRGKLNIGDDQIRIEASSVRGEALSSVAVSDLSGTPLSLQVNLKHLRDFAKTFECEQVSLEFNTSETAFLLRPLDEGNGLENFCVGMPLI